MPESPRAPKPAPALQRSMREAYGKLPLYFIENRGQLDAQVAYYIQGHDASIYFTGSGVTFALTAATETREPRIRPVSLNVLDLKRPPATPPAEVRQWAVKLEFLGANPNVKPAGRERTSAVVSYFKGRQSDWKTGLATYSSVVYENLWPGIDLVYSGRGNRLKYEFVVQPGATPEQIKLAYRGATALAVNSAGQLEISTPVGGFSDDVPYAYQEVAGKRVDVRAAYALDSEQEYGFRVGAYDRTRPLVLDPVLLYAGYIGGVAFDAGRGIAVDSAGNAYVTGITDSTEATFPVAVGPIFKYAGGSDAFVAKVNPAGTALVYAGYFGGSGADAGNGIAVDSAGNAYVTGYTNSTEATFPVAVGPKLTYNGGFDAFVAKVNPAGTALVYAGYIGGAGDDYGSGIAVDSAGNAYVTGDTNSTEATFPVSVGPKLTYNGGFDAFVAKVNPAGTALIYAGYIGGSGDDFGRGIAVDSSGNAYITGSTGSTEATFPVTVGPKLTYNGGREDAFVANVNAAGTSLVYAGYIGGSGDDFGGGIAVDGSGNAYVAGTTNSTEATFPVAVGPKLTYNRSFEDAFVAKVNAAGTALVYAGYIGGSGSDVGYGIAVDRAGSAYVTGFTDSTEATFPVAVGPKLTYNGGVDAFVAKVNAAGTALAYAGYIGGSSGDAGTGIAVDGSGNAYVTGYTFSTEATFPVTGGPKLNYNGGVDAFVAKISADTQGSMPPSAAVVSAASYRTPLAPASIASLFGSGLSSETAQAQLDGNGQLPTELAGVSIQIGGEAAQLFYVSPGQINFVMPASINPGTADIVVQSKDSGLTLRTSVEVRNTAPGLFSLNQSGSGPGAILNAVTFAGGPFFVETAANLGDDKRTRLAIYGTGIRYAGNPFLDPSVTNSVAGVKAQARDNSGNIYDLPVEFAGVAPVYFGLDQVNVVLPPQLDGAGLVSLTVNAENATSNAVTFTVGRLPDSAVRLERLSLAQTSVSAGSSVKGTVTLNAPARVGGFPVSLSSTSSFVQTPGSVTVPAGQVSANFTLLTSSSGGGSATIVATANNVSRSALLTVTSVGGPVLSTLTLSASSITGGTAPLTGTVTISGPAQAGGALVVVSASSSVAQPQAMVTIPFGQTSATFTIPTTAVTTAQMVTITASFGGTAKTATITLNPIFTFTLSPDTVTSGQMVTGTVSLSSPTPFAGANVHFTSSRPLVAAAPQVVTIPGGQTSASVRIATGGATSVETVTITAEYLSISQAALLTVIPVGSVSLAKLEVNPTSVKGGNPATGTITLTAPAGIAGVSVTLQSSSPLAAQVPTALTIPSGQTTATFSIQTMPVTSSQTVTITASAGGVTKNATLTVQ